MEYKVQEEASIVTMTRKTKESCTENQRTLKNGISLTYMQKMCKKTRGAKRHL